MSFNTFWETQFRTTLERSDLPAGKDMPSTGSASTPNPTTGQIYPRSEAL